jgi:TldD protein
MELNRSIFFEQHNVTTNDLETYLGEALSRGGDYADLYFEYRINHAIVFEEHIIKSAAKGVNVGIGVRVISGEKTGYAYSDDLDRENIVKAARTAAFIANTSSEGGTVHVPTPLSQGRNLYNIPDFSRRIGDQAEDCSSRAGGSCRAHVRSSDQAGSGELCR